MAGILAYFLKVYTRVWMQENLFLIIEPFIGYCFSIFAQADILWKNVWEYQPKTKVSESY